MKSILLSIKPEWLAKILNGEKTIEVRKLFPKEYVGWVYLYCSKDTTKNNNGNVIGRCHSIDVALKVICNRGKIIARFWCDKVETISLPYTYFGTNKWVGCENERTLQTETMNEPELLKKSCISEEQIYKYLNFKKSPRQVGFAIHISKLEIFNKPKELSEFYTTKLDEDLTKRFDNSIQLENGTWVKPITKAPQNYCYVEGE